MDLIKIVNKNLLRFSREEPIDYKILEDGLRHACQQLNIKDVDGFLLKCIQLFETTIVRHGKLTEIHANDNQIFFL
jgi:dynein heavy chain